MSVKEELKKIPAKYRPLAQLLVAALAELGLPRECEKKGKIQRPSLEERERMYKRRLIFVREYAAQSATGLEISILEMLLSVL